MSFFRSKHKRLCVPTSEMHSYFHRLEMAYFHFVKVQACLWIGHIVLVSTQTVPHQLYRNITQQFEARILHKHPTHLTELHDVPTPTYFLLHSCHL